MYKGIMLFFSLCSVSVDVNEVLSLALPLTDIPIISASSMNVGLKVRIHIFQFLC